MLQGGKAHAPPVLCMLPVRNLPSAKLRKSFTVGADGDYKDGQVVETFNIILKRILPYLGSMNEPRQASILKFTAAASNTSYRDGARGKMEDIFGVETLCLDVLIWRRFCDRRALNVAIVPT